MKIGIITGGGPAPGFNGVINAVTTSALARGWTVYGIPHGYAKLMSGDIHDLQPLTAADVAGIEATGGTILGTRRANPLKGGMDGVVASVKALELDALVTIGGDDTASAAAAVGLVTGLRVAHVPKTIDNDLPLPGGAPTFGFETAKNLGATLCQNLRVDAASTGRWYLVTAMGRSAGHLALGMGVASGADLIVIPEEYLGAPATLADLIALVRTAIEQRRRRGQDYGMVVLGEGLLDRLDKTSLHAVGELELDEHGNPRMSEIDLGKLIAANLSDAGTAFVTKLIGYELRCADPVAFDVQYTRTLGVGAVEFLANGNGSGIICLQDQAIQVLAFADIRDADGRVPVRRVDLQGAQWQAALALQARDN